MSTAVDLTADMDVEKLTEAEFDARIAELLKRIHTPKTRHLTGKEIVEIGLARGLIGCRPDITDGIEHARKLRERSNRRHIEPSS